MTGWKRWLVAVAAVSLFTACSPTVDVGGVANRAANRAVERVVDRAVDRAVQRIADRIFDLIIAQAIDGLFGVGADGEVVYGPDFALELYTGSYRVTLAGDGPVTGEFAVQASEPADADDDTSLGVGLRGVDDEGEPFLTVTLLHAEEGREFSVTFVEGREDDVTARIVGVGFEDGDVVYSGEAELQLIENSDRRIAGSFRADNLTSEDAPGLMRVSADFDVPINPAGSLFIRRTEVQRAD